jgi:hypothetical protein
MRSLDRIFVAHRKGRPHKIRKLRFSLSAEFTDNDVLYFRTLQKREHIILRLASNRNYYYKNLKIKIRAEHTSCILRVMESVHSGFRPFGERASRTCRSKPEAPTRSSQNSRTQN